jgi:inner membrane protein
LYAILWALLIVGIFHRKNKRKVILFLFYFLCTISHGILDSFTTGGDGIGFLMPFSTERYFSPYKVIQVSPIGISRFFSEWGVRVLKSEFFYIGIPSILFYILGWLLNRSVYQEKTNK